MRYRRFYALMLAPASSNTRRIVAIAGHGQQSYNLPRSISNRRAAAARGLCRDQNSSPAGLRRARLMSAPIITFLRGDRDGFLDRAKGLILCLNSMLLNPSFLRTGPLLARRTRRRRESRESKQATKSETPNDCAFLS